MSDAIKILIDKYLRNECSSEEEQQVLDWLEENDVEAYDVKLGEKKTERRVRENWNKLTSHFPDLKRADQNPKMTSRKKWFMAAVTIGILFLGALGVLWNVFEEKDVDYVTDFGEVKSIVLPDGSSVTLNAKSSITLNKDFNETQRIIYLTGQAFFQVKEEANRPFIVKTGKVNIKVLGTSFDVSAFENDAHVAVALKEGKVLVESDYFDNEHKNGILLNPGEEAVFEKETRDLTLKTYNKEEKHAWQRQTIYFENANISEVLHKLERFYGVSFDTERLDENKNWQLSGTYQNQTLKEILESLSFNYELGFEIKNKEVTLFTKK